MSADNTIIILKTMDTYKREGNCFIPLRGTEIEAFRVAEITSADDILVLEEKKELLQLGVNLDRSFGNAPVWYDRDSAWRHARKLADMCKRQKQIVEYGIQEYDLPYSFPF